MITTSFLNGETIMHSCVNHHAGDGRGKRRLYVDGVEWHHVISVTYDTLDWYGGDDVVNITRAVYPFEVVGDDIKTITTTHRPKSVLVVYVDDEKAN